MSRHFELGPITVAVRRFVDDEVSRQCARDQLERQGLTVTQVEYVGRREFGAESRGGYLFKALLYDVYYLDRMEAGDRLKATP